MQEDCDMIVTMVISFSLSIIILLYIYISKKDNSFVNVLTPIFITLLARYILELVYYQSFGMSGSLFAYFYNYAVNTIDFACFSLAYVLFPKKVIKIRIFEHTDHVNHNSLIPYLFLILSCLLFLPIIIKFYDIILSPREIYLSTRKGYGYSFYLSSTLLYLSLILFQFKKPSFKGERLIADLIIIILLLLHGSKGQILLFLFIIILYNIYIMGRNVNLKTFIKWSFCICAVVLSLFYITFPEYQREDLLLSMALFSNYDRNAMMVIDSDIEPQYGRLTMENELYCRIPRPLYPGKPKDFGTFYLAKKFYPAWFDLEQGSPAFGYGTQYADFNAGTGHSFQPSIHHSYLEILLFVGATIDNIVLTT